MHIHGYFDLQFEAVKDAFAELFNDPQERGAALCVQIGGETVLDLWAGMADRDGQEPWHSDTILNLYSCTKAFTAVAALQLVGEGKLELDEPVARQWPEFAAAGKLAVRQEDSRNLESGPPGPCRPAKAHCWWSMPARAWRRRRLPIATPHWIWVWRWCRY